MSEYLTFGEQADLEEIESKITLHLKESKLSFLLGVSALAEVKELELWRGKYKSFKDYCERRWNLTARRIYQLMEALEISKELPPEILELCESERQLRALADVPPENREGVVRNAASRGSANASPTSPAAPATPRGRVPKKIELDEIGTPIPDDALPFWQRRQEANDIIFQITQIKSIIKKGNETLDPFYLRCGNSALMELSSCYQHLIELRPYAVCTQCQGSPSLQPDGCNFCRNSGLISKRQWDTQSMAEVKEMRLKSNNARNGKH